jgi:hypothetical protein
MPLRRRGRTALSIRKQEHLIPAQAGIQIGEMDTRIRGYDKEQLDHQK